MENEGLVIPKTKTMTEFENLLESIRQRNELFAELKYQFKDQMESRRSCIDSFRIIGYRIERTKILQGEKGMD